MRLAVIIALLLTLIAGSDTFARSRHRSYGHSSRRHSSNSSSSQPDNVDQVLKSPDDYRFNTAVLSGRISDFGQSDKENYKYMFHLEDATGVITVYGNKENTVDNGSYPTVYGTVRKDKLGNVYVEDKENFRVFYIVIPIVFLLTMVNKKRKKKKRSSRSNPPHERED